MITKAAILGLAEGSSLKEPLSPQRPSHRLVVSKEGGRWNFQVLYGTRHVKLLTAFSPARASRRLGQIRAGYAGKGTR